MTWIAAAIVGGALIGGVTSNHASNQASNAANNATNAQQGMFDTTNAQQAPWRQAGLYALRQLFPGQQRPGAGPVTGGTPLGGGLPQDRIYKPELANDLADPASGITDPNNPAGAGLGQDGIDQYGMGGSLDPQFQTPGFSVGADNQTAPFAFDKDAALRDYISPAYNFMLSQGLGGVANSAAGQSGLMSGNALKGISDYASNYALNAYLPALQTGFANQSSAYNTNMANTQNIFNRNLGAYNANQANTSNIFNRLSTIAGLGSASANTSAGVGAQTGANIGNSMIAGGNAAAAGTMGVGNALSGGLNNLAVYKYLTG